MPYATRAGARIWWSALGKGEPLVLIMGLGCSSALWFRLAPRLARRYRVILLDNRGVGQTEVSNILVHSVRALAADVGAVLDAARERSAHVLGLSMGGMIAQQFALDYPERVRSLLLLATNCGGSHAVLAETHVWRLLFDKAHMSPEASLEAMRPYTYAQATPPARIAEDHLVRLANFPSVRGYQAQLYGLLGWSSYADLPRLECPTLVMHGVEDRLIPPVNGEILADRIRNAEYKPMADASHWLQTDQTEKTCNAIRAFTRKYFETP